MHACHQLAYSFLFVRMLPLPEEYLKRVLASLIAQLPQQPSELMFGRILVMVVNVQGDGHLTSKHARKSHAWTH
jgi:hypothetical protein